MDYSFHLPELELLSQLPPVAIAAITTSVHEFAL